MTQLTGSYLTIYRAIEAAGEAGLTVDEVADAVYPGLTKLPENPRGCVVSMVRHVRRRLDGTGVTVSGDRGRRVNRYRLVRQL